MTTPTCNTAPGIPPADSVRRILVCQLRQIGDVLLSTPSIELLARHYPKAQIHVLTELKCMPMLENNPHIHTIWPIDKQKLAKPWDALCYYRQVADNDFDMVVDFQQLPRCLAVVALSRAKVRLTYPPPWYRRFLYTHWHGSEPAYAAAYKAGALRALGICWNGEPPRLYLTDKEKADAAAQLLTLGLEPGGFISVDATHKHETRRWPARHYARLLDLLAERHPGLSFLLPFGPGEEQAVQKVKALCACKDRVVIPGAMQLRQLAALISHAAMQIGNCSSPRHMAVALDVPSVTVLGSSSTGWSFPSAEHIVLRACELMPMPCQPCNKLKCPTDLACLEQLTPALVIDRVDRHFTQFGQK